MNNKIYYHYCSVDTFYNILQTDIIRFGNPLKMNDSDESIWFPAMVKDFLFAESFSGNVRGFNTKFEEHSVLVEKMQKNYQLQ